MSSEPLLMYNRSDNIGSSFLEAMDASMTGDDDFFDTAGFFESFFTRSDADTLVMSPSTRRFFAGLIGSDFDSSHSAGARDFRLRSIILEKMSSS